VEAQDYFDAYDFRQAQHALNTAEVIFNLDDYGPRGAEMTYTVEFTPSDGLYAPRAQLTVYKGAHDAYLYGSRAAHGYSLDIAPGQEGLRVLITHESGHGVLWRNLSSTGRPLRGRERLADEWVHEVWPGRYR
jgi:hypothetical protein